jgi:hypothetical protein
MTAVRITPAVLAREITDPGPGVHLWHLITAHRIAEDTVRQMAEGKSPDLYMDTENMVSAPALGCAKCEQPYSRYLFHRKCTGSLEVQP